MTPRCAHEGSLESARCLRYNGAAPKPTAKVHGQDHKGIIGVWPFHMDHRLEAAWRSNHRCSPSGNGWVQVGRACTLGTVLDYKKWKLYSTPSEGEAGMLTVEAC
jgi:hypothetical protein